MLDFKIKTLKREVEPKEKDIAKLKADTLNMDKALKKYNTTNATLGHVVDDLRIK